MRAPRVLFPCVYLLLGLLLSGAVGTPAAFAQTITSLNPTTRTAGGAFTLTVTGTGFASNAVVKWNGTSLTTHFTGDPNTLTADIPVSLVVTGKANITVTNPGVGTSGTKQVTVYPQFGIVLNPKTVAGGGGVTGTITLAETAPYSTPVTLTDNSTSASVPASVSVGSGTLTATFPVTTTAVSSTTTATVSAKNSNTTHTANLTITASAGVPANVTATPRSTQVLVDWDGVAGATSYNVYRATSSGGEGSTPYKTGVSGTSFLDQFTEGGTNYWYTVSAIVGGKESAQSKEASAMSGPALGWIGQPRAGVSMPGITDYDWTGLTFTHAYHATNNNGTQGNYNSYSVTNIRLYNNLTPFTTDDSSYYLDPVTQQPLGDDDLSVYGYHDGIWSVSGKSTYKWLWTPPTKDTDSTRPYNDPSQSTPPYPKPSLFVLAETGPYAEADAFSSDTPAYMTTQGSVGDGFSSGSYAGFDSTKTSDLNNWLNNGYLAAPDPYQTRRKILTANQDSVSTTMNSITLAPYFSISYNIVNNNVDDVSELGDFYGAVTEDVYPLALVAPDPFVRPDLGDLQGYTNQFVYSNTNPSVPGVLSIPAEMSAATKTLKHGTGYNVSPDDLNWLIADNKSPAVPHISFLTDGTPNNVTLSTSFDVMHGVVGPQSTGTDASGNNLPALKFSGLPTDLSGFGNHKVALGVRADTSKAFEASQEANIQIFFNGLSGNWPGNDNYSPNWWYYYNQVYAANGNAANPFDNSTSPYSAMYFAGPGKDNNGNGAAASNAQYNNATNSQADTITIHDDAYANGNQTYGMRVFDINNGQIRYVGVLALPGVFETIYTFGHEQGHVVSFVTNDTVYDSSHNSYHGYIYTKNRNFDKTITTAPVSNDGDNIWDFWEYSHFMDGTQPDSTHGAYDGGNLDPADDTAPDDQFIADLNALDVVTQALQSGAWASDWDSKGFQFGLNPYFIVERYGHTNPTTRVINSTLTPAEASVAPTFYLKFLPKASVVGNTNLPPINAQGYYEITSLADLRKLFPNVVTRSTFPQRFGPQ